MDIIVWYQEKISAISVCQNTECMTKIDVVLNESKCCNCHTENISPITANNIIQIAGSSVNTTRIIICSSECKQEYAKSNLDSITTVVVKKQVNEHIS